MRVLNENEVSEVSGGTLCRVGGLLSGVLGLLKKPKLVCAPAPKPTPAPAPAPCKPAPRKGHC